MLVLDEPTNHLDIPSRGALEEALDAYDGTIVTISHDRYFLDRVATQILALDGEGRAEHYDGDYTEYHDWKAARRAEDAERERAAAAKPAQEVKPKTDAAKADVKQGNASSNAAPKRQGGGQKKSKKKGGERDPHTVEAEVAETEKRLASLTEELASPAAARDPALLARLNEDYARTDERLRSLYEEWERAVA